MTVKLLTDPWFWSTVVEFLLLVAADRVVRAYKKLAHDALDAMEERDQ